MLRLMDLNIKGCLSDNYNICNYNILTAQLLSKLSENDWDDIFGLMGDICFTAPVTGTLAVAGSVVVSGGISTPAFLVVGSYMLLDLDSKCFQTILINILM